ncbi:anaphase-promoting complex subunit 4 [Contarinia nasturtii]|uniref:anaphase-promoting complex subunit 4 n=1 Tax=Contarinia nasturtii TaxID=265458 RepID=UPI0012D37EAE|nr:anaphase-promoting complex subunit 4 [Contarinia nasturtii]
MQSNLNALMRLHQSKGVRYNIELLTWSHKMDLIAMSNDKGEVIVQRLNLQGLWTQPPPYEDAKVCGISWRPDERILAIGYNSGRVILVDVENHQAVHTLELKSEIVSLNWTQNTKESYDDFDDLQGNTKLFANGHKVYLPPLPNFSSLTSNTRKNDYNCHTQYATRVFNLLMVGLKSGVVRLFVFGMLPCGQINVKSVLGVKGTEDFNLCDMKMSSDFNTIFVLVRHKNKLRQLAFQNPLYSESTVSLLKLATQYGYIVNTLAYIEEVVQCIIEAWETALLEMDRKLTNYVNSRPDGVVSADFLELLLFGYAPDPLVKFLTRDLTDKGMKKLGNSIEITYSTIQQLVIRPLHTAILNLSYHLNYLKGMSKNTYYYKDLLGAISSESSLKAGAFLIKSLELQQVIEQSNRDFKIFWGWLYGVIVRLMEEAVPEDVAAVSQQDTIYLAEFLNTFDEYCEIDHDDRKKRKFNLERVGQYLQNQNLQKLSRLSVNSDWGKLLEENECLKNSNFIYPHHKELSLVQEHNNLKDSIRRLFEKPDMLISLKLQMVYTLDICDITYQTHLHWHQFDLDEKGSTLFSFTIDGKHIYVKEFIPRSECIKFAKFQFPVIECMENNETVGNSELNRRFPEMKLVHTQFYNEKAMSMLFTYKKDKPTANCFVQFPIQPLLSRLTSTRIQRHIVIEPSIPVINLRDLLDPDLVRPLDINDGTTLAVSGGRKIATIISISRKKFYHFEMEVDEGDYDDDDNDGSDSENVDNETDNMTLHTNE